MKTEIRHHETPLHALQTGRVFYCEDSENGKQFSLRTRDAGEAQTLLHSRNEATRQAHLNLRIAQTYLAASDPVFASRTWQTVMDEFTRAKTGRTHVRCDRASREKPFDLIRGTKLIETCAEQFFRVLQAGSVFDEHLPAALPQLRPRPELAAVSGHPAAPVAPGSAQGEADDHSRGA